jgi:DNA adenine methylase
MISYIGGKARIGKWIVPYIPNDIETYVEPFSGMFWVFFNMDLSLYPNLETVVYNDFNKLNSNLMKCSLEYDRLHEELNKYDDYIQKRHVQDTPPQCAEFFSKCQKEVFDPNFVIEEGKEFEAAVKYVFVLTQVFSGSKPETSTYTDYKGKYRCKVLIFMDKLKNANYQNHFDKISFVENLDFEEVIEKYDSEKSYFYVDPPYWKTENYYSNHDFDRADHERLAESLKSMEGRFSLSYYNFSLLEKWFPSREYRWSRKNFKKSANAKKNGKQNDATELLIMNYGQKEYFAGQQLTLMDMSDSFKVREVSKT